uniref:Reverse transcriptase Ty1/copia-type domain-containing protein n=1 Tax=Tanacetum cinerariifolium TaxID=118510 RepID=A0A6L2P1E7_TANCI|nr:hypothetical protein [Tanacetum cinerariifolium]
MGIFRTKEDEVSKISTSIFVSNFLDSFSSKDLFHACKQYGHVVDSFIPSKREMRFDKSSHNTFHKTVGNKDIGNSFVNVVKGSGMSLETESTPTIVLDDECLNTKDLSCSLMGRVKEFTSLTNLKKVLCNEGFDVLKISYLGELWVLIEFESAKVKDLFKENSGANSWFSVLNQAYEDFTLGWRIAWVEVEGIPFKLWSGWAFWLTICNREAPMRLLRWCRVTCDQTKKPLTTTGIPIMRCNSTGDLYPTTSSTLQQLTSPSTFAVFSQDVWHHRLGHPGANPTSPTTNHQPTSLPNHTTPPCSPVPINQPTSPSQPGPNPSPIRPSSQSTHINSPQRPILQYVRRGSAISRLVSTARSSTTPARTIHTYSMLGISKQKNPIGLAAIISPCPIPCNPKYALSNPNWKNAMIDEYNALIENKMSQKAGVVCDDTFSPVVNPTTIRTVLSLAISKSWPIHQLDVKNAFLYDILGRAGISSCKSSSTPVDTKAKLSANSGNPYSDPTHYRSLTRALHYLTFTRLDFSYVVQQTCLHMHDRQEEHMTALKRILRYVQDTCHLTSVYCVYLGDNLISWSLKRQPTLSRSSDRRVANVVFESCWLRNLLLELHCPLQKATLVYCDNVSTIFLSGNPVQHQRTKHIEMDIHFVRGKVARGDVCILHVPSRCQIADIFTKGLPRVLFDDFRDSLSIHPPPASTAGVY